MIERLQQLSSRSANRLHATIVDVEYREEYKMSSEVKTSDRFDGVSLSLLTLIVAVLFAMTSFVLLMRPTIKQQKKKNSDACLFSPSPIKIEY